MCEREKEEVTCPANVLLTAHHEKQNNGADGGASVEHAVQVLRDLIHRVGVGHDDGRNQEAQCHAHLSATDDTGDD